MPLRNIEVLDTTLRDGAQAEGIGFSPDDKLKIAGLLAGLGIPFIEGGNPLSNQKDAAFFEKLKVQPLLGAALAAFGSTHRPGADAAKDAGLDALLKSGAPVISLFGKASLLHVRDVLRATPEENLRIIASSVRYLVEHQRRVFFDAEHFFDAYREDKAYALECLRAAAAGGASLLVLCDTNGGALPDEVAAATREVVNAFTLPVGIHCHNDSGLAVANTLSAVQAGACHIQGTFLGVGERCGNADLCTLLPLLQLKCGYSLIPDAQMRRLTPVSRTICEIMNLSPNAHAPFVGSAAFAHKAGMHIDGVLKASDTFEQLAPELVGNQRRFLVSEQAGRAGVLARLKKILPDIEKDSPELERVLKRLKDKEYRGYTYENADASFELMALDTLGLRKRFFDVIDFHVLSRRPGAQSDQSKSAEAYIKIVVDGKQEINAAEGDGPVNALDEALRKALCVFFPGLAQMRLKDFKVRVLDSGGTASTVRVSIESTDGVRDWGTVGVSTNIIQACFKALVDSVDYMLTNHHK